MSITRPLFIWILSRHNELQNWHALLTTSSGSSAADSLVKSYCSRLDPGAGYCPSAPAHTSGFQIHASVAVLAPMTVPWRKPRRDRVRSSWTGMLRSLVVNVSPNIDCDTLTIV